MAIKYPPPISSNFPGCLRSPRPLEGPQIDAQGHRLTLGAPNPGLRTYRRPKRRDEPFGSLPSPRLEPERPVSSLGKGGQAAGSLRHPVRSGLAVRLSDRHHASGKRLHLHGSPVEHRSSFVRFRSHLRSIEQVYTTPRSSSTWQAACVFRPVLFQVAGEWLLRPVGAVWCLRRSGPCTRRVVMRRG